MRLFSSLLIFTLLNLSFSVFADNQTSDLSNSKIIDLEAKTGVTIGVSAINTANNQRIQYRAHDRFPFGSTYKMMGVATILKQSMTHKNLMNEKMVVNQTDLVDWVPITEKNVGKEMTVLALSHAAISYSDSGAINILVKKLGGPEIVNAFAKSIGDDTFNLVSYEPVITKPNDIRDTTTPAAMEKSVQQIVLGNALAPWQREQILNWMTNNTTGDTRIRAGVPKGWKVADKTGSGSYGVRNDIGIIWPPTCEPIVLAIYTHQDKKEALHRDDVLADVTRIILAEFAKSDQCIKTALAGSQPKNI